jgi:Ca2+:H+ antiporter
LLACFDKETRVVALTAAVGGLFALALRIAGAGDLAIFGVSAVALAGLAALVGKATDQLGVRLGPSATGVLQSGLGNLPEFFICIFALQAGLVDVVRAALVGSILANTLFVLGLAFIAGGLKHGTQRFGADQTRLMATLLVLAVAAMAVPTVATSAGAPAQGHEVELSVVVSIVLLIVFLASIPASVGGAGRGAAEVEIDAAEKAAAERPGEVDPIWPLALTLGVLLAAAVGAAFVSDWFVASLEPAIGALGMSQSFAGLVVVAIAGNAVENVIGVRAMIADKADLAISVILNSSLQVALALTPVLVLVSLLIGGSSLTLVVPPLFVAGLALTAMLAALVVMDGESTWIEGVALVGLYAILAASVWWGPRA